MALATGNGGRTLKKDVANESEPHFPPVIRVSHLPLLFLMNLFKYRARKGQSATPSSVSISLATPLAKRSILLNSLQHFSANDASENLPGRGFEKCT